MSLFYERNKAVLNDYIRLSNVSGSRSDYVQGGGGNTSVKFDGRLMAIKASGYCLCDVKAGQAYAVLDYRKLREFYNGHEPGEFPDVEAHGAEQAKGALQRIEGMPELRPSVEAGFHSVLKRFVSHTHSVYANLACCSNACRTIVQEALADADYPWGWVAYSNPGATLTFAVRDEMRRVERESGRTPSVFFLQNHGLVVHDECAKACLQIQEDANRRLAAFFGLTMEQYPAIVLKKLDDGLYESDVPFMEAAFRSGKYNKQRLVYEPLCPDQMVFLVGAFEENETQHLAPDTCAADPVTGKVRFRMDCKKARVTAEVLTATIFLQEHIPSAGYSLSTLNEAAKEFINSWESEKYRKSLAGKK